jgi:hypothetical protein
MSAFLARHDDPAETPAEPAPEPPRAAEPPAAVMLDAPPADLPPDAHGLVDPYGPGRKPTVH